MQNDMGIWGYVWIAKHAMELDLEVEMLDSQTKEQASQTYNDINIAIKEHDIILAAKAIEQYYRMWH